LGDPVRYVHIVTGLAKTIEIQKVINLIYPKIEKGLIGFLLGSKFTKGEIRWQICGKCA
jgi:hypothetical protein